MAKATISKGVKTKTTWANALKRDWQLYLLLMIPVALVVIFNYASYGGIRMVFMDYKPAKGYAGSKWVGWATFQKVFKDKDFIRALKSSIVFNLLDLAVGFPMPIILALILNTLQRTIPSVRGAVTSNKLYIKQKSRLFFICLTSFLGLSSEALLIRCSVQPLVW